MALITCDNLTLGYEGRAVLNKLSFAVHAGDYLCIVGANGSGKTTLMRAILGLQPPMEGQVVLGDGLKRGDIGYLPQQSAAQRDFPASVWEVVRSGCLKPGGPLMRYTPAQLALARQSMQRLGIENLAGKAYRRLSGGQQQRVLLARALCAAQKVLLLDEPVAGLDPQITAELYLLISRLNAEGVTILMISHDIQAALRDATHLLHLQPEGWFYGTRAAYLQHRKEELA